LGAKGPKSASATSGFQLKALQGQMAKATVMTVAFYFKKLSFFSS
jgi:hypothetical protein